MANQPVTTEWDNSQLALRNCLFDDATITVPATTTLAKGTVLGPLTASGAYTGFATDGAAGEDAPVAILMQELVNDTGAPVDVSNARVLLSGEVSADLLVFANGTDTVDTQIAASGVLVKTAMKNNGITAVSGLELCK
jgi:hypothetical protein